MHSITFQLEQSDIDNGVRGSDTSCLFALAIRRRVDPILGDMLDKVSVVSDDVVLYFKDHRKWTFHTGRDFVETLETFDWIDRKYIKPGTYTLTRRID